MRAKSYTSLWDLKGTLYSINDVKLLFPVSYQQIGWYLLGLLGMVFFGGILPLTSNVLIKYIAYPVLLSWFMSKKSFDGKAPPVYFLSCMRFWLRPKVIYGEKKIKNHKRTKEEIKITGVRSEIKGGTGN